MVHIWRFDENLVKVFTKIWTKGKSWQYSSKKIWNPKPKCNNNSAWTKKCPQVLHQEVVCLLLFWIIMHWSRTTALLVNHILFRCVLINYISCGGGVLGTLTNKLFTIFEEHMVAFHCNSNSSCYSFDLLCIILNPILPWIGLQCKALLFMNPNQTNASWLFLLFLFPNF